MVFKIFLDTNIIIDFFDARRSEHETAVQLFDFAEKNILAAHSSETVLNTTVYILRKEFRTDSMKTMLNHLLNFLDILPCSNTSYRRALQLSANDLEDAVLYQLAIDRKLDYFVTSNKKDFKNMESPLLPVVSAKELMKLLPASSYKL